MKNTLLFFLTITTAFHSLSKAQISNPQINDTEQYLVSIEKETTPIFAYVAKEYTHRFGKAEDDYKFLYKIRSKKHNLASKFEGVNLEEDGHDGGIATFSGVIYFIVQYRNKAYIINMYFQQKNVFSIYRAIKLSNGDYEAVDDSYREGIILPELYSKLEYLFSK